MTTDPSPASAPRAAMRCADSRMPSRSILPPRRGLRGSGPLPAESRGSSLALLAVALALLLAASAPRAAVLAAWNFNGPLTGTLLPSSGSGRLEAVGVGASIFASGEVGGGSSDPAIGNPPDYAWQVSAFPPQGTGSGTAGIRARVDTSGFASIVVSFDFRATAGSARHQQFRVTLDGYTFLDWGAPITTAGVDPWVRGRRFDLSGLAGASANPLFGFQMVSVFAPGTEEYQAVQSGTAYSTAGGWRFDMLEVWGEAPGPADGTAVVPLPSSGALLLAGGLLLCLMGRYGTRPSGRHGPLQAP